MSGYYYLHQNGELIYKPHAEVCDLRDSDFVRAFWPVDPTDRAGAWSLLIEAQAAGANPARVAALAVKWFCDDKDAAIYADVVGARVFVDGGTWCAARADFVNVQKSPVGFGTTALAAMAELAKALHYQPSKMWGTSFTQLLKGEVAA